MFNTDNGFPNAKELEKCAHENRIVSMKIMLEDGSLKYIPLYSIFDSTTIIGQVQFEKKGVWSKSWKRAECKLDLQT